MDIPYSFGNATMNQPHKDNIKTGIQQLYDENFLYNIDHNKLIETKRDKTLYTCGSRYYINLIRNCSLGELTKVLDTEQTADTQKINAISNVDFLSIFCIDKSVGNFCQLAYKCFAYFDIDPLYLIFYVASATNFHQDYHAAAMSKFIIKNPTKIYTGNSEDFTTNHFLYWHRSSGALLDRLGIFKNFDLTTQIEGLFAYFMLINTNRLQLFEATSATLGDVLFYDENLLQTLEKSQPFRKIYSTKLRNEFFATCAINPWSSNLIKLATCLLPNYHRIDILTLQAKNNDIVDFFQKSFEVVDFFMADRIKNVHSTYPTRVAAGAPATKMKINIINGVSTLLNRQNNTLRVINYPFVYYYDGRLYAPFGVNFTTNLSDIRITSENTLKLTIGDKKKSLATFSVHSLEIFLEDCGKRLVVLVDDTSIGECVFSSTILSLPKLNFSTLDQPPVKKPSDFQNAQYSKPTASTLVECSLFDVEFVVVNSIFVTCSKQLQSQQPLENQFYLKKLFTNVNSLTKLDFLSILSAGDIGAEPIVQQNPPNNMAATTTFSPNPLNTNPQTVLIPTLVKGDPATSGYDSVAAILWIANYISQRVNLALNTADDQYLKLVDIVTIGSRVMIGLQQDLASNPNLGFSEIVGVFLGGLYTTILPTQPVPIRRQRIGYVMFSDVGEPNSAISISFIQRGFLYLSQEYIKFKCPNIVNPHVQIDCYAEDAKHDYIVVQVDIILPLCGIVYIPDVYTVVANFSNVDNDFQTASSPVDYNFVLQNELRETYFRSRTVSLIHKARAPFQKPNLNADRHVGTFTITVLNVRQILFTTAVKFYTIGPALVKT